MDSMLWWWRNIGKGEEEFGPKWVVRSSLRREEGSIVKGYGFSRCETFTARELCLYFSDLMNIYYKPSLITIMCIGYSSHLKHHFETNIRSTQVGRQRNS